VVRAANDARNEQRLPPLPVAVTAHTFRRTYVTLMLEAGAPLTYVQDQVGHEDTKTTQEIYARSFAGSSARRSAPPSMSSCTGQANSRSVPTASRHQAGAIR